MGEPIPNGAQLHPYKHRQGAFFLLSVRYIRETPKKPKSPDHALTVTWNEEVAAVVVGI